MAIYKRYKGKRLKRSDADRDKGTWWIEFSLRGEYVHQSVPGARTRAQAEQKVSSEKLSMNGNTIPARSYSPSLSMKHSYLVES